MTEDSLAAKSKAAKESGAILFVLKLGKIVIFLCGLAALQEIKFLEQGV